MTKKLNLREEELLCQLLCYAKKYDDCCPCGVGMGPTLGMLLDSICEKLSFEISQKDKDIVVEMVGMIKDYK